MPNDQNTNGWPEWSKYVLKELERLNSNQESFNEKFAELRVGIMDQCRLDQGRNSDVLHVIRTDIESIKAKIANIEPSKVLQLQSDVDSLKQSRTDHETRMRDIEKAQTNFAGRWAIIAGIGGILVASVIGYLFKT